MDTESPRGPPVELTLGDPLAKRALHYLARDRSVTTIAPPVLEALDGALVTDHAGRIVAFGAILRHDVALIASRFGPILKVSEDGVVSCFLDGVHVWGL